MPQMAWLFSTAHVIHRERNLEMTSRGKRIEKFRKKFQIRKRSHGLRELPRMDSSRQTGLKNPKALNGASCLLKTR